MKFGIGAAITWGLDTVILSIALSCAPFFSTAEAIALASFVSTFMHDACSAVFMFIYMGIRKKLKKTWQTIKTKGGKWVAVAALIGGPIGMTGYVMAINNIGAAYTAAFTAFFPAYGAALAHFTLKEKMKWYQWIGLIVCLCGVAVMGYFTPSEAVDGSMLLGILGSLMCVFGWGTEAVIVSWALHGQDVDDECALQIRQTTSALTYAIVILPLLPLAFGFTAADGWKCAIDAICSPAIGWVALAACIGTASYLFYYKAIDQIGAPKSMALNITYSAWAIVFSFIILGAIPDMLGIVCAIVIIVGAIVASTNLIEEARAKRANA